MKKFKIYPVIIVIIITIIGILTFYKKYMIESIDNQAKINDNTNNQTVEKNHANSQEIKKELNNENTQKEELFSKYYKQSEELMKTMTLEEKVGQMFLARFPKTGVIQEITNENPGGYILFARDFSNETKESILQKLNNCQANSKINLLLGVDEEGGTVVRVSSYTTFRSSKFLSPQDLWAQGQLTAILDDSKEKSELLKSIGLNMNLAPVVDVATSSSDFIYARSYGKDAKDTAIYTSELIKTMNAYGMISSMKHFPGYGDNVDTHTGIAIDKRPYSTFETSDFLPFRSGIKANGPTVLVSHNIVNCMDETKPASLSEKVHEILRDDLGFSGVIITDDLAMNAVKTYIDNGETAVQAVLAGNDMIISSDFTAQKKQVVNAVKSGEISEETINTSVRRILAMKYTYDII